MYDKRFMYEPSLKMPFLIRWPGVIKPGSAHDGMILNVDFAPTFMDIAGLKVPDDMQGRSILPLLKGRHPADWRKSMYYRYYHDPGDHNTAAHYGVCTTRYKLIHYWKKGQWELYDLEKDPLEMRNIHDEAGNSRLVQKLKAELYRLKKELKDDDQFANEQPPNGVDPRPATAQARRARPLSL
jgi:arylsulfatase A-like enzyme